MGAKFDDAVQNLKAYTAALTVRSHKYANGPWEDRPSDPVIIVRGIRGAVPSPVPTIAGDVRLLEVGILQTENFGWFKQLDIPSIHAGAYPCYNVLYILDRYALSIPPTQRALGFADNPAEFPGSKAWGHWVEDEPDVYTVTMESNMQVTLRLGAEVLVP